jgi:DNA repair exonuclease SbcCD nuclease subunit
MTLPPNVHVFPTGRPHTWTATRDGRPLARVAGTSREHATAVQLGPLAATGSDDCFHIGVAHRVAPSKTVEPLACHYWALGGRHRRTTVCTSPATCHDPGSTQGRGFDEPGAHGCTLVAVDEDRKIRTTMIATDVVRYVDESVTVDDCEDRDALEPILRQRIGRIAQSTGDRMSLVRLHLECSNPQGDASQRRTLAAELTDWLRVEFGHGEPAAWAVGLDFRSASVPEALSKQETILGDFLRAVEHYESNEEDPIELDRFLSERHVAGCLAAAMRPDDPNVRRRVLREAAQLGIDLLGVPGK